MADLHYERIPIIENNDPLVDIARYPFIAEPAYYKQGLSDTPYIFMRRAIAENLARLQEITLSGYQFKIWDCWRPRGVQANIYNKFRQELRQKYPHWDNEKLRQQIKTYVADPGTPGRIPPHATGGAIDLTLVDKKTGAELDMGTGFDHFGPQADPNYFEHSGDNISVRNNRRLLHSAMCDADFTVDPDEWWHFDYGNQKWAEAAHRETAIYGEVVNENGRFFYVDRGAK
jgi:D-alanyl-D-alanine dipeptidase